MAQRRRHKRIPANEIEVRELQLSTENDGDLYRQRLTPIYHNLARKKAKKIYKHKKAVKLMRYAVDEENKKYKKDFGVSFNTSTRDKVADNMTREFEHTYKQYLPKNQKKFIE
jgi:hypothetical protein